MLIKRRKEKEVDLSSIGLKISRDENEDAYMKGFNNYVDLIMPSGVETFAPQCINIDGAYIACLLCVNYPYNFQQGLIDEIVNFGAGVEVCIRHEPAVNKSEVIKDITHFLGFTKYKMGQGDNQIDSGTQENAYNSSVYMKKKLSEGDDFWYINTVVRIIDEDPQKLEDKIRKVSSVLAGKDIFFKRADFRQLEAFLFSLPLEKIDIKIKEQTTRNILSSGICGLYPYTASTLQDPDGMFMGLNDDDNSPVNIDIFNTENYYNANVMMFGGSGSGKTFTSQMFTGRFRMQKIPVMLVCPLKGHEYKKLCDNVGGNFLRIVPGSDKYINMMDIGLTKNLDNPNESLLAAKLQKLAIYFSLMFPDITKEQLKLLDGPLRMVYEKKGITMENSSLFRNTNAAGKFSLSPKLKEMPLLQDVQAEIGNIPALEKIAAQMEIFITGSMNFLNRQTNVDIDNLYTVADVSDMEEEYMGLAMFLVLEKYMDKIKHDITQRVVLLIDEFWRLMKNRLTAGFIVELQKIIRGYGGSLILASQDIEDCFVTHLDEDGKAIPGDNDGKKLLSNSTIKLLLKLQESEADTMAAQLKLSDEERTKVTKFKKGHGLIFAGSNHLTVNFKAFETEKRLITTDRKEILKYREGGL